MDATRRDCLIPKIETLLLPFPPFGGTIIGNADDVSTRPPPVNFGGCHSPIGGTSFTSSCLLKSSSPGKLTLPRVPQRSDTPTAIEVPACGCLRAVLLGPVRHFGANMNEHQRCANKPPQGKRGTSAALRCCEKRPRPEGASHVVSPFQGVSRETAFPGRRSCLACLGLACCGPMARGFAAV